jgi:GntR family transcriptional regulator
VFMIDTRSATPIYEQLEQNIISLIAAGALTADEQLPSVRTLARELGVNPNTVQKSYSHLEQRGIIYQAAGRGSFVAPPQNAMTRIVAEKREALCDVIRDARRANVPMERIIDLVRSLYEEETV